MLLTMDHRSALGLATLLCLACDKPSAPREESSGESTREAAKLPATSRCAAICSRSTELGCAQAGNCERLCADSMTDVPCEPEMAAATACMLTHPASDWECSDDGFAAIKSGVCTTEQEAFAGCMTKELGGK